jgi:hypothetical protein
MYSSSNILTYVFPLYSLFWWIYLLTFFFVINLDLIICRRERKIRGKESRDASLVSLKFASVCLWQGTYTSQNALGTYKHNLCSTGLRNLAPFPQLHHYVVRTPGWYLIPICLLAARHSTLQQCRAWTLVGFKCFFFFSLLCYFMCFWYPGPFFYFLFFFLSDPS